MVLMTHSKAEQLVIDPALYHGACADMERIFAEMSSGKKRTAAGVEDDPPAPKIPKAAPVTTESAPTSVEGKPAGLPVITAVVTKAEPSSSIVTTPQRAQKARRSKGKPQRYGSTSGASTSTAAAAGTVDVLQTVAALQAAGQPISLSTGPVDKSAPDTGGNVTTAVTSESEQSSDEHVVQLDTAHAETVLWTSTVRFVRTLLDSWTFSSSTAAKSAGVFLTCSMPNK